MRLFLKLVTVRAKKSLLLIKFLSKAAFWKSFFDIAKNDGLKCAWDETKLELEYNVPLTIHFPHKPYQFEPSGKDYDIKVSAVMATYNRQELLPALLDAWRKTAACSKYKFEIIMADDGSDDNTLEILKKVDDLPLTVVECKHQGVSRTRSAATARARGEKILFMGDDMYPNPELINQHYEKLVELGPYRAVLGNALWHKDIPRNYLMKHILDIGNEQFEYSRIEPYSLSECHHFYTCNISVDAELLNTEPYYFDSRVDKWGFEDIELGWRLSRKGLKIYYYPEAYVEHYHVYDRIDRFYTRQEVTGESTAKVSDYDSDFHQFTGYLRITGRFRDFLQNTKLPERICLQRDPVESLVRFTQIVNDLFVLHPPDFSRKMALSNLFITLFHYAYDIGMLNQVDPENFTKYRNEYFIYFYCNNKFTDSFKMLREYIEDHRQSVNGIPDSELTGLLRMDREWAAAYRQILDMNDDCLLEILVPETELESFRSRYSGFEEMVRFNTAGNSENSSPFRYEPTSLDASLTPNDLIQVMLILTAQRKFIDGILVSKSLKLPPEVSINSITDNFVFRSGYTSAEMALRAPDALHKLVRFPGGTPGKSANLHELTGRRVIYDSANNLLTQRFSALKKLQPIELYPRSRLEFPKRKPLIFVFPGSLEQKPPADILLEIIKRQKSKYDFVVFNTIKMPENSESMHSRFFPHVKAIFDLPEYFHRNDFIYNLEKLQDNYNPIISWLCGGSKWYAQNTHSFRKVMNTTSIIDQQVHDAGSEWIRNFRDFSIQQSDRFVAVNQKIYHEFVNTYGIPREKIDLIPIDSGKPLNEIAEEYGKCWDKALS